MKLKKCMVKQIILFKQAFGGSDNSGEEKEIFIRALVYLGLGTLKIQRSNERIEARSFLEKSLEYADQSNDAVSGEHLDSSHNWI